MRQNVSFLPELKGLIYFNIPKSEMQFLTNCKMFQCLPTACLLMGSPHIQETKTQVSIGLKTNYSKIHLTMHVNSLWTFGFWKKIQVHILQSPPPMSFKPNLKWIVSKDELTLSVCTVQPFCLDYEEYWQFSKCLRYFWSGSFNELSSVHERVHIIMFSGVIGTTCLSFCLVEFH